MRKMKCYSSACCVFRKTGPLATSCEHIRTTRPALWIKSSNYTTFSAGMVANFDTSLHFRGTALQQP